MRRFLFWLAEIFRVDLTTEKVVKVVEVQEKQVALSGYVDGDVMVKGNLTVNGRLEVTGDVICLTKGGK